MIKSVRIQNFESHKDTMLEFGPGINVISGDSDSGKSAIIRAITWVATNRPAGDSFRSHWGGETSVALMTDDLVEVIRIKDKENIYRCQLPGDGGYWDLKAFGQDVPEQISRPLNLSPINFQPQFDPHFLLPPVAPGEVARRLNEAVDLEVIDRAQTNINAMLRDNDRKIKACEAEMEEANREAADLDWVAAAEKELAELEKMQTRANNIRKREADLNALVYKAEELDGKLAEFSDVSAALAAINSLISVADAIEKAEGNLAAIDELIAGTATVEGDIRETRKTIDDLTAMYKEKMPNTCPLCGQEVRK